MLPRRMRFVGQQLASASLWLRFLQGAGEQNLAWARTLPLVRQPIAPVRHPCRQWDRRPHSTPSTHTRSSPDAAAPAVRTTQRTSLLLTRPANSGRGSIGAGSFCLKGDME
jgi:hypothetical protein